MNNEFDNDMTKSILSTAPVAPCHKQEEEEEELHQTCSETEIYTTHTQKTRVLHNWEIFLMHYEPTTPLRSTLDESDASEERTYVCKVFRLNDSTSQTLSAYLGISSLLVSG